MRTRLCAATVLFLGVAVPSAAGLTQEQLRADLQSVLNQLPTIHPNLFFSTSPSDFYAAANRLDAELPQLTAEQFYTRLSALIAALNDTHTALSLTGQAAAALGFTPLPLEFRNFSDGMFVTGAAPSLSFLNRARVLDVNGTDIESVLVLLRPQIAHANDSGLRAGLAAALSNSGILRGLGIAPSSGPIPIGFRLSSGERITVAIDAGPSSFSPSVDPREGYRAPLQDHAGENYWSVWWPRSRTVYVRYALNSEMASRPVARFTADTLDLMDRNPLDTLVIDLRGNPGGSDSVTIPLVAGIIQRLRALGANPRFRAYTLIDGGTFSSAMNTAMYLKVSAIPVGMGILGQPGTPGVAATLVGEPTGASPTEYGEVRSSRLPQSNLDLRCSTRFFRALAGIPEKDAMYPDIPVNLRSTDYFARHDPVLAAVLARASSPPGAPSGGAIVVNAASFRPETGIAPGSLVAAFGDFPDGDLKLTVDDVPVRLLAATRGQLVFVVPPGIRSGPALLRVMLGTDPVSSGRFEVTPAGPGLFVADSANTAQPGAILNEDGLLNRAAVPASRGSIIQIFATGAGAQADVWIANLPAEILFSGPVAGVEGLWQINVRIPDDPAVAGQVPVFIAGEGRVSNGVTIFTAQ